MKVITVNKKAFHDYEVLDTLEAGVVLSGDEVKSLRLGHAQLKGSFVHISRGELFLVNVHISAYAQAYDKNKSEEYTTRSRKLLVTRADIDRLIGEIACKGIALVPIKIYFNKKGKVKVEVGICKGKKAPQKKEALRERDIKRETARDIKGYR